MRSSHSQHSFYKQVADYWVYNSVSFLCTSFIWFRFPPYKLVTKSRTVKHNEEKNVKLLPRVHIGVPLIATLVLCLDRSNKNEKTSGKKGYFTQANKLMGISETIETQQKHLLRIKSATGTQICVIGYEKNLTGMIHFFHSIWARSHSGTVAKMTHSTSSIPWPQKHGGNSSSPTNAAAAW